MQAAVVHSYDQPPRYEAMAEPVVGDGEVLVEMLAAGLHPVARSKANGKHYSSTGLLPMIPGIDGVGRLADGSRVFFTAHGDANGTMAQRVAVPAADLLPISDDLDAAVVAASVNPAISSWLALRTRAKLQAGESVLVLGATGNAGSAAIQLARYLGASRVIGAGRNPTALAALPELGADAVIGLDGPDDVVAATIAEQAADVDVVLDYLWGPRTELALAAITAARRTPSQPLRWVHIGAVAGPTITLPAAMLRKVAVEISGSGIGSVAQETMNSELAGMLTALSTIGLVANAIRTPLSAVEKAWQEPVASGSRIVFVP